MGDGSNAALLAEAERFLNFPYVWGGSSQETSFDCSGYISYILRSSGVKDVGRLGAQGLYNICTPVSPSEANINKKSNLPLRSSEMGLLILACKNETPVTSVMAADFFKVKKPMIAAVVSSLTQKEYLNKLPSGDKRSFILSPTDKALSLVEETFSLYLNTMALLKSGMGDDYKRLIELLEKANAILLEDKDNG